MNDNLKPEREELSARESKAIGFTLLFLTLGFAAIGFAKIILGIDKDAVFVSVLLLPALIYFILSGRLTEFKAPGGLEAKFAEVAKDTVKSSSETIDPSVQEMQVVDKAGMETLQRKRQEINEAFPIVMTMTLGKGGYESWATRSYIEYLSQFRNFKFVVFLDEKSRFVAYIPSWVLKGLLNNQQLGFEFIKALNEGRKQDLFSYPSVVRETISVHSTNAEALQEMTKQNLEALVVLDEKGKLKGVVEREQILSRMMLALIK